MPQQSDELRLLRHIADLRFEEELRGYSKSQVDRVLQKLAPLANQFEELHLKLAEAENRVASAEARLVERSGSEQSVIAPPAAAPVVEATPSEHEMAPVVARVQAEVPPTPADFDETLRKTLVLAQRTADETVKEAYDEADRITNNAHSEADLVLGKATTEAEQLDGQTEQRRQELQAELEAGREQRLREIDDETEARRAELEMALVDAEGSERAELLEQIADLQQVRTMLKSDIESLEGHLATRREMIQSALDEVANVLDDPDRLRSGSTPELSAVAPVSAGDYIDVGIDVDANLAAPANSNGSEAVLLQPDTAELAEDAPAPQNDATEDDDTVEQDDLPELPQRRKAAALTEEPLDSDSIAESDQEIEQPEIEQEDDREEASHLDDDPMISISEAIPSIDDQPGPTPDASGPPTEEFSFVDIDLDAEDSPALPLPPEVTLAATEAMPFAAEAQVVEVESTDPWVNSEPDLDGTVSHEDDQSADRPAWMDAVPDAVADGPPPPPPAGGGQDPFLDQLRKATGDEGPQSDEALDRFFEGDEEENGERRPWFGRRR